ncbi:hypothetical protein EVAR_4338_1 [Eumeta japonica]|uniref:Uncharacterized protein n=1 Tax=Eumeta variegata TaxID=151549 RepID=A0A4C1VE11_EUMVA|nr:hypothetical protein EVAR_4338_1 [Eumeta japonica]
MNTRAKRSQVASKQYKPLCATPDITYRLFCDADLRKITEISVGVRFEIPKITNSPEQYRQKYCRKYYRKYCSKYCRATAEIAVITTPAIAKNKNKIKRPRRKKRARRVKCTIATGSCNTSPRTLGAVEGGYAARPRRPSAGTKNRRLRKAAS